APTRPSPVAPTPPFVDFAAELQPRPILTTSRIIPPRPRIQSKMRNRNLLRHQRKRNHPLPPQIPHLGISPVLAIIHSPTDELLTFPQACLKRGGFRIDF